MKIIHAIALSSLIAGAVACSGISMNPSHQGHYTFSGTVADSLGRPIQGARVKVLGWETLTDAQGRWRQDQIVECGASRDSMEGRTQQDTVLVFAEGHAPVEHGFEIERAAWFASCPKDRMEYSFQSVLRKNGSAAEALIPAAPEKAENHDQKPNNGVTL